MKQTDKIPGGAHAWLHSCRSLAAAANDGRSSEEMIAFALRAICELTGWPIGHAHLHAAGFGALAPSDLWQLSDRERFEPFRLATQQIAEPERDALVGRALKTREPVWADDLKELPGFLRAEIASAVGIRSGVAVPVLARNAVVSVLEFFFVAPAPKRDCALSDLLAHAGAHIARVFERERAERELREQERLAALGNIAAVFGHEVGNTLNGISMSLQILLRSHELNPAIVSALREAMGEIGRLAMLLDDFRAFSRAPLLQLEPTELPRVAEEVLRVEKPRCEAAGIEVRSEFNGSLPPLLTDAQKLKQVLINLCHNAVDAMPGGGVFTLRAFRNDDRVVVEAEDTGVGVPAGIDVFEPFKTTKPNGTGLGLAVVQKIVAAHGGSISYRSERGKGTTFRVELPVAAPAPSRAESLRKTA